MRDRKSTKFVAQRSWLCHPFMCILASLGLDFLIYKMGCLLGQVSNAHPQGSPRAGGPQFAFSKHHSARYREMLVQYIIMSFHLPYDPTVGIAVIPTGQRLKEVKLFAQGHRNRRGGTTVI
jgi:hypothetical protein